MRGLGFAVCLAALARTSRLEAQTGAEPSSRLVAVTVEAGHEGAVRFQQPADSGDRFTRTTLGARQLWRTRRGALALAGHVDATHYVTLTDLDRVTYDLAVRADRKLTSRLTADVDVAARRAITSELRAAVGSALIDAGSDGAPIPDAVARTATDGALLPQTMARLAAVRSTLAYRLSERTTTSLDASYSQASFDTPLLLPGTAFVLHGTVSRRTGPASALAVETEARYGTTQGKDLDAQSLIARWEQRIGRSRARVTGGVARSAHAEGQSFDGTGSLDLSTMIARGTASLRYARALTQAFGLGTLLRTDRVGVAYQYRSPTGLALTTSAQHGWNSDPVTPAGRLIITSEATAELVRVFPSGLLIGNAVSFRRREQNPLAPLQGVGVRIFVGVAIASGAPRPARLP